jgi:hypothetical protein
VRPLSVAALFGRSRQVPAARPSCEAVTRMTECIGDPPDNRRVQFAHCGRWFNDMTAAGEDPIAVIQWPIEFVDREWPLSGKSNVRWQPSTARAFYLVGSGAELEGCIVGGKAGVPPFEVLAKMAVDDSDSHLKQKVCTLRRPTHLLRLRHALVDDLVDGRLHERARDALTSSIPTAIVG